MPYSDSDDSADQEFVKRVLKSEKKKEKRKLVESREDVKPRSNAFSSEAVAFLDARKEYLKVVDNYPNTQPIQISPNEEVWIFQCPKNIDIDDLLGRKLELPKPFQIIQSKRGNRQYECKVEVTKQENCLTMICPTNGFPEAVSVKQAGLISIRDRVELPQPNENGVDNDADATDKMFYFPTDLKIRHPLLGVNYDLVTIKQEKDDSHVRTSPSKKKKANGNHSTDRIKIKEEPEEVEVAVKKEKKRNKRPRESIEIKVEPDDDVQPSKKQKHKKARLDEDSGDLESAAKQKRTSIKIEPDSS